MGNGRKATSSSSETCSSNVNWRQPKSGSYGWACWSRVYARLRVGRRVTASAILLARLRARGLVLALVLLPWPDARGELRGERETLQALLYEVTQTYGRGDLEGSWAAYRRFLMDVPPGHADWLLLTHCRSCPSVQELTSILGRTAADLDFFDNVCPRQPSGARPRGWICDQLIELLYRKQSLLGERPDGGLGKWRLRLHRFYFRSEGDLRPWVTAGWRDGVWGDSGLFWIVDTGAHTTVVDQAVVEGLTRQGRLSGLVERLGTSREVHGPYGRAWLRDALVHEFSVGRFRVGSMAAAVAQLDVSAVGMNVLLRFPAVCFSWESQVLHLGDLGPCTEGITSLGARLSGSSPVLELVTGASERTRVLVDTGSRETYCGPGMERSPGQLLRFGDHEDMWLSCGDKDAAFLRDGMWYEAITGMDTLSRFDAFGWRLHPFTMYFVAKADR